MRTKSEVVKDWCAFYRQSPLKYEMNALIACYKSDGEGMLVSVLNELGLQDSVSLVKEAANK